MQVCEDRPNSYAFPLFIQDEDRQDLRQRVIPFCDGLLDGHICLSVSDCLCLTQRKNFIHEKEYRGGVIQPAATEREMSPLGAECRSN